MQKLKSAIIGLGNIGASYDNPKQKQILTHAHALKECKNTQISAICDQNLQSLKNYKWGKAKAFSDYEKMLKSEKIELLVIAAPTNLHYKMLKFALLNTNIKHIICEKPFVENLDELCELEMIIDKKKPNLIINFIREYDPSFQKVAKLINAQKLGKVLHFNATGVKGFYHNGTHTLNLLEMFFGNILDINTINKFEYNNDIYGNFKLNFKEISGNFSILNTPYSFFELDIYFELGIIKIQNSGFKIDIYKCQNSKTINGAKSLIYQKTLPNSLQFYAKNSLKFLLEKNTLKHTKAQISQAKRFLSLFLELKNSAV